MSRNEIKGLEKDKNKANTFSVKQPVKAKRAKKVKTPAPKLDKSRRTTSTIIPSARPAVSEDPSSASSMETDTDESIYESSDEEELEITEAPPLPATKPTDPVEAIKYDTTKIVWRSARRGLSGDEIKAALGGFNGIIKTIRDKWNALEKAETEKTKDAATVKTEIAHQRGLVAAVIATAIKVGHSDIIERLGDVPPVIFFFCAKIIRDRIKADDITGSLMMDTLEVR